MASFYGIKIDGETDSSEWNQGSVPPDEKKYEQDVEATLKIIKANPVGLLILTYIKEDDDDLTIVPYSDRDAAKYGDCNNSATPDKSRDASPKGEPIFKGNPDNPRWTSRSDQFEEDGLLVKGTGKGSNVKVHYTAMSLRSASCQKGIYGSQPDESLLHELVHGVRQLEGHSNKVPTPENLRDYENDEEFLAIVVTNVYISAKKNEQDNKLLRANHNGHTALQPPLNTSEGFLSDPDNLRVLAKYYWMEFALYQDLALVNCDFNPFSELVFYGALYRHPEIKPKTAPQPPKPSSPSHYGTYPYPRFRR